MIISQICFLFVLIHINVRFMTSPKCFTSFFQLLHFSHMLLLPVILIKSWKFCILSRYSLFLLIHFLCYCFIFIILLLLIHYCSFSIVINVNYKFSHYTFQFSDTFISLSLIFQLYYWFHFLWECLVVIF